MTFTEASDYIEQIPSFAKKNTPENTRELLRRLGDPQEDYRIIHVAGTNGKGSVCAFSHRILQSVGKRTGLFTSPHLVTIRERFVCGEDMISEEEFAEIFDEVMVQVRAMEADGFRHPAYFELLLAMGFVYFSRCGAEYLILETGLGGLKDATNVIEHPAVCVITSVSRDHTEFLGDTIPEIAAHKAGIIKPGVPVIYDANDKAAAEVIWETAQRLQAKAVPCYARMADIKSRSDKDIAFVLNNQYYDNVSVCVPFPADYQVMNASLAMTAMKILLASEGLSSKTAAGAVASTAWRGRMECIAPGVIVDGAHNEDGIHAFLKAAGSIAKDRPVSLLFTAVMEKEYEQMIREICESRIFTNITVTQIEGHRKVDADCFADIFRRYTDVPVHAAGDIQKAYEAALAHKEADGILLCAGSLYLVGELEALTGGKHAEL